ncbi:UDP-N-acetylglucosamine--dolichyl-phosphate_N-acetylglucosaminephosphotransferase [Hexamita inflata]|uniref:UDP-N-acetylglucosamine--dolichyl-phosphate N-acetylglucosaminephosphotransferase n=1 Tax=Hexamita inflata TaxID=28002 RepID=A0AA86UPT7_9EUKA|nr:UDP-N-acetylglucosamine--dolichyl-phosphate N-acetylglucosaminephosphotransferase [Hexamita inflata]CAI9963414.1 UDP-N-acetylglucosamine--dolichyl-phosphate N-acetylglucosaminephosphotransferase [Hexamita inflata]
MQQIAKIAVAAIISYIFTKSALPIFLTKLSKAGMGGFDLNKPRENQKEKTPEAGGIVGLFVFSMICGLFKGIHGLLSACICSGLLGFADNVLNLEWRWKLIVPAFTLIPLCSYYQENYNFDIQFLGFNFTLPTALTYAYIIFFSIFCQNAVNIYAGINGIEVGQSIVAQLFALIYLVMKNINQPFTGGYYYSAIISTIFIATSLALLKFNKYPAKVFVGDVFTYFAGCVYVTSAVCGDYLIMAIFLYFMQMINFLLSVPQLIGIIPCPRHRLPQLNKDDGKLYGKTENWNLINQYLLRIVRAGLGEKQIWQHLITIQVIGSACILCIYKLSLK